MLDLPPHSSWLVLRHFLLFACVRALKIDQELPLELSGMHQKTTVLSDTLTLFPLLGMTSKSQLTVFKSCSTSTMLCSEPSTPMKSELLILLALVWHPTSLSCKLVPTHAHHLTSELLFLMLKIVQLSPGTPHLATTVFKFKAIKSSLETVSFSLNSRTLLLTAMRTVVGKITTQLLKELKWMMALSFTNARLELVLFSPIWVLITKTESMPKF